MGLNLNTHLGFRDIRGDIVKDNAHNRDVLMMTH